MSMESWKKEFCAEFTWVECKSWTWEKCIEHSIRKWKGLLVRGRSKHKVISTFNGIKDEETGEVFVPSAWNCALCVKHSKSEEADAMDMCKRCPIVKVTKKNCFRAFGKFGLEWNPIPMIRLLERVLVEWRNR